MPSPTETLLRSQDSPVPTQTISGFEGSIATAPIDCTSWRSKTGLKVVPPFTDFQTPPLAEPTNIVSRPFRTTASRAAMRPLIVAEPMLRAGSPETVAASNLSGCCAKIEEARKMINREIRTARVQRAEAVIYDPHWTVNLLMRDRLQAGRASHAQFLAVSCFLGASFSEAGKAKSEFSSETFTSIDLYVTFCHELGSFLGPPATENGNITPPTGLYDPRSVMFSRDRKSTCLNSSHSQISYAVFCLKKKKMRDSALDIEDQSEVPATVRIAA